MNDQLALVSDRDSSVELPAVATTRSGVKFAPRLSVWHYRDNVKTIHLDFAALQMPDALKSKLKHVLLWYAQHRSPSHLHNLFERLCHFASTVPLSEVITASDLMNYRSGLPRNRQWYLTSLAGLFKRWYSMGITGISAEAFAYLSDVRLKGNKKGEAVLTMDSRLGRFTDLELDALIAAMDTALNEETFTLGDYVLCMLFFAIGARPIQYAALKLCDFTNTELGDGAANYMLAVPRAKQREAMARVSFTDRVLVQKLGQRVFEYTEQLRLEFKDILPDSGQAPMFPHWRNRSECPGFEYHGTATTVSQQFKRAMSRLKVMSERTRKPVNVAAVRCRRSIGCRAAEEGHSVYVIASLLDQTDTQNTGAYVESSPAIIERIDKAVAFRLAPLAQAFMGTLISDEAHASRAGDLASRIGDPRFDIVGNCGKYGFCSAFAPIACYLCRAFEPWLDANHEAVLEFLLAERERLRKEADERIASVNDRAIVAVAQVVQMCVEEKEKRRKGGNA
jgi:hypothetical protein